MFLDPHRPGYAFFPPGAFPRLKDRWRFPDRSVVKAFLASSSINILLACYCSRFSEFDHRYSIDLLPVGFIIQAGLTAARPFYLYRRVKADRSENTDARQGERLITWLDNEHQAFFTGWCFLLTDLDPRDLVFRVILTITIPCLIAVSVLPFWAKLIRARSG